MLSRQLRTPVSRLVTRNSSLSLAARALQRHAAFKPQAPRPTISLRTYANGRPHPPGGTHRINLGGGGEKEESALEKYGVDLTARAKAGKLDPVIGRDAEIHRTIQVLSRRTKNNPVLIGSAGMYTLRNDLLTLFLGP